MTESVEKKLQEMLAQLGARAARVTPKYLAGVVFLDGEVESDAERAALTAAVRALEGVRFVQDRLRVTPATERPGSAEWRRGRPS